MCHNALIMSDSTAIIDPKELRPLIHQKVDALGEADLAAVHELLLEVERRTLFAQLADEAEGDRVAGKLDPSDIEQAIHRYRQRQPYR